MTDMFTGMPFYWQGGGGGGLGGLGGNAATGQPAMSSSQINASMGWNPYASFNPFANTPGGFGGQTAAYSNLGAAFGRQTGGFGGGGGSVFETGAPAFNPYGMDSGYNPFDSSTWAAPAVAQNAPRQYGWDANEGAPVPSPYRAPMQYGWGHNEGAPAPAAPNPFSMGQFRPQTYGWDHNEGAAVPGAGLYGTPPSGNIYGPGIYNNSPFGMDPNPGS